MNYTLRFLAIFLIAYSTIEGVCEPPKIIAFLGTKGVGKDTSADFLVSTYGYQKYALADPMKNAVSILFHFSEDQLWGDKKDVIDPFWGVTPREIMQFVGIDMLFEELGKRFPHIGHAFPILSFELWRQNHPNAKIVISDLRMQQDLDALKKMGALIIRIERPDIVNEDKHSSESNVSRVTGFDLVLVNDGTIGDLEQKILEIMESYNDTKH
jgi:hypothetical protein